MKVLDFDSRIIDRYSDCSRFFARIRLSDLAQKVARAVADRRFMSERGVGSGKFFGRNGDSRCLGVRFLPQGAGRLTTATT